MKGAIPILWYTLWALTHVTFYDDPNTHKWWTFSPLLQDHWAESINSERL